MLGHCLTLAKLLTSYTSFDCMNTLSTGLITDGSSAQALIPLLTTLISELLPDTRFEPPHWVAPPDKNALSEKLAYALDPTNFQFDILFVHRDAENESIAKRVEEITQSTPQGQHPVVCVIPVKMTETWLITSEKTIKEAVGNPLAKTKLKLPAVSKIESCNSKDVLDKALTEACEYGTQRRRKFKPEYFRRRVAELTSDLTTLRKIPSFKQMEEALINVLQQRGILHVEV